VPIGEARVVREGDELSIFAYGSTLDRDTILSSARKTGKVLIAHEATRSCGVGAEVAALIGEEAFEDLDAPVRRLTTPDVPVPFSPPLEQNVLPGLDDMKEAAGELLAY
jgi:2-oxoisovalerate dehydrogenase E1 component beta subunit